MTKKNNSKQVGGTYSLEERRAMVTQEMFNQIYTGGDPSTLSHSELDQWNIPRMYWGDKIEINNSNPDMMTMTWEEAMNGKLTVDTKTAGETTIQFPKPHQPEPYNPNKPSLDTMTFKFEQESNCVDGGEGETLIVEAKSSLGIDGDGGAFYVLRTEQWAISDIDDIVRTLERVKAALDATKPTSIHVK